MTSLISKLKQPSELLNHILDLPALPDIIQNLDAGVLTKLICHVGLEDSGQIISLVTADQLKGVLDEDLWHSQAPGRDEIFDAGRFSLWLEIMMENGASFAARKVMELDEDLLTLGLCRLVWVVNIHDPSLRLSEKWSPVNDNILEKILDSSLNQEFGNYRVVAKNNSRWDTVCALMAELNELDYEKLIRLLNRCCWISGEDMEDQDGPYHVLTAEEMLEEDLSSERQERREGKGFVTPTSAAVFLSQARSTPLKEIVAAKTLDPVSRAYFRAVDAETEPGFTPRPADNTSEKGASESINLKVIRFIQTLQDAEVLSASDHRMLLSYDGTDSYEHPLPLAKAMRFINKTDPALCSQRLRELSYLSNTLISGCQFQGHVFQPKEAAEAAFSVCNLGSEYLLKTDPGTKEKQLLDSLTVLLKGHHLVKLFQAGWKILFDAVVLHTAKAVLEFINHLKDEMTDPEQTYEMARMANMLRADIVSGRPWRFKGQMDDLLFFLDGETTMAIAELLQEYPTLSEVICKKGGHRLSPFIWSQTQIRTIHRFLKDEFCY